MAVHDVASIICLALTAGASINVDIRAYAEIMMGFPKSKRTGGDTVFASVTGGGLSAPVKFTAGLSHHPCHPLRHPPTLPSTLPAASSSYATLHVTRCVILLLYPPRYLRRHPATSLFTL